MRGREKAIKCRVVRSCARRLDRLSRKRGGERVSLPLSSDAPKVTMTDAYYSLCTFFDVCHASAVGEGGRDGGRATGCSAAGGSPESPVGPLMSAFSPPCGCDIAGAGGATRSSFFVVVVAPVTSLRIRLAAQQLRPDPKRPHAEYAMRDSEIFLASASASVRLRSIYPFLPPKSHHRSRSD